MRIRPVQIICVWLLPMTGHADPTLNVAVKGGVDAATLAHDYRVNRYGVTGGLEAHLGWSLLDRISLAAQVDLLYTPRGAEVVVDDMLQGKIRQHYLDIVVAARPEIQFGMMSAYLLLGGGLNLLASANTENASGVSQVVTDDLHRFDVALVAGVGVGLHFSPRVLGPIRLASIFLEGRHDHGLFEIDPVVSGFKNRTNSVMFGMAFDLASGKHNESGGSPGIKGGTLDSKKTLPTVSDPPTSDPSTGSSDK